ncbi:hypothetical protein EYF80_022811 [Liparis tanakae]|uniref:Uncharacterized protein n=1 Tax=Liparis tanakae TaxID=230148 RepID=A0A4Z2HMG1_9TELE|nr:hypothetical protein EYF80_022811 [Liparis tanakae]
MQRRERIVLPRDPFFAPCFYTVRGPPPSAASGWQTAPCITAPASPLLSSSPGAGPTLFSAHI